MKRQIFLQGQNHNVPWAKNAFLCMHPSVMKTLQYIKGSFVLLHTEPGQLLFRCWPCDSLEPSTVMLPSKNFFEDYLKGPVFTDFYNLSVDSADMIILNCDNLKLFMKSDSFKKFLKTQLDFTYIREGLKINIIYLGYPCSFTVKNIYSHAVAEMSYQESLLDICRNVSSLNISEEISILENSIDERSFICSTPISAKNSGSHKNLLNQEMKQITNTQNSVVCKPKQFYCIHTGTKIIIQNSQKVENSYLKQITLHHLGGLKKQINEMKSLAMSLINQEHSCGIMLIGASGTGKTAIVQAIGNEFHLPIFNFRDVISSNEDEYKYQLKRLYNEVVDNSPSILFLDNLDGLHESDDGSNLHEESELIFLLSAMIYDLLSSRNNVLIIGATQNITAVNASLRKAGTLEKEIYFEMPSAKDRKEILNKILNRHHHNLSDSQICELSEKTHGFAGGDLKLLCDKASIYSYGRKLETESYITFEDLKETLKNFKPSSMIEFMFEVPKVKWSDIGGMNEVKTAVTEMVDWPLKHAEKFKKLKITPPRGILLYGPPGCSKTMIAKALVSEGHLNFISVKGPQLFNKYVGESEKAVSELFNKARSAAPCVLFFDEIDSMTSVRGSTYGNSNVADRILSQLLVEIDGIDILEGVSIIAATNRPDMIDPSFLRPGRFDRMIYVPLPDCTTRKEIFEAKLKNMPLSSDIDVSYLVEATEGYTGAEIIDVCREAAMSVIKDYITSPTSVLTMFHFLNALKFVVPRTSQEMIKFYENYSKRNS